MPDFSRRSTEAEYMDDLAVDGKDLHQALRELESINYLLGGNYVTLRGLDDLVRRYPSREWHIADLGCGSGDMLRRIRQMLDRKKINARLTGVDANRNVIEFAKVHTPVRCRIAYLAEDILSASFSSRKFDIVTATLFFHHFTDEQLINILGGLRRQTSHGMVINDIHRHWFAYHAIRILTRLFSRSEMVRNDGPVSVLRAFRRKDLERLLAAAGIDDFSIRWRWAFRWQVIIWFARK